MPTQLSVMEHLALETRTLRAVTHLRCLALLSALINMPAAAMLLDDTSDLEGKTIVYAGEFERLECPIGGKYDCLKWPTDLLRTKGMREICLVPTRLARCSFMCKGFIAVGDDKRPYAYLIDGIGNDIRKSPFESYKCPDMF